MIELDVIEQLLSESSDLDYYKRLGVDRSFFPTYTDYYEFIDKHFEEFNEPPSLTSFITKFPDFEPVGVRSSKEALFSELNEYNAYNKLRPLLEDVAETAENGDSLKALEKLKKSLTTFDVSRDFKDTDIISDAKDRYDNYLNREFDTDFIPTGFTEIDQLIGGYHRGEELVLFYARTNEGKTWAVLKSLATAWEHGETVGFITPEMSPERVGYRIDTSLKNLSNQDLIKGIKTEQKEYSEYISSLEGREGFKVIRRSGFPNRDVTVPAIRNWVIERKITILAIDGISYIRDTRAKFSTKINESLENIVYDLFELSSELGIPILVVAQANREGENKGKGSSGVPKLTTVRNSDGIAQVASKAIAIRTENTVMTLGIAKNRDGIVGSEVKYSWNANRGIFSYMANSEDVEDNEQKVEELKNKFKDEKLPF